MPTRILHAATRAAYAAAPSQQEQCEAVRSAFGGNVTLRIEGAGGQHLRTMTLGPFTVNTATPRGIVCGSVLADTAVAPAAPGAAGIAPVRWEFRAGSTPIFDSDEIVQGPIRTLCQPRFGSVVFTANPALPATVIPAYVPTTVGAAAVITTTNSLQDVRPNLPGSLLGLAMGIGDYSGGAVSRWAGLYGKHLVHGGGHAISDDASVYSVTFGTTSVSWERLLGMYDLRDDGTWYTYDDGGVFSNSIGYFVAKGAASTLPATPTNPAGWAEADDTQTNPREYKALWPGSCHSYDTIRIIPPPWASSPQGDLLRHGSFAVGVAVSRDTFIAHRHPLGAAGWNRLTGAALNISRTCSIDNLRGRVKPHNVRGYRDLTTGAWVNVSGSVTGLPSNYDDNEWSEYHEARDVHVYVTNTEAETTAGTPSKWAWWPGGDDNGTRNLVTWAASAPPSVATPGGTGQASLIYIDALAQLCYYTRADQDAYYLITVPTTPSSAWSWTRVPITGAGRPSLLATRSPWVYRRWDWVPALKSISYVPLANDTGASLNKVVLIRVVA